MGALDSCGYFCMCISVWGIIQLALGQIVSGDQVTSLGLGSENNSALVMLLQKNLLILQSCDNIMGICFKMEVFPFIEEAEAEEADDIEDFMKKTKINFTEIAINCFYAAAMYVVTLFLSFVCIFVANKKARVKTEIESDDELTCNVDPIAPEIKKDRRELETERSEDTSYVNENMT